MFINLFKFSFDGHPGPEDTGEILTTYDSIPMPNCLKTKQTHLPKQLFISVKSRYFVPRETLCPGPTSYQGIFTKYPPRYHGFVKFNAFKVSRKLFNCDTDN